MPKRTKPRKASPLDDYKTKRGLAGALGVSQVTAGRLTEELNWPFILLSGKRQYRVSALTELLRAKETTLDELRKQARRRK